jgi:hypothetical protein
MPKAKPEKNGSPQVSHSLLEQRFSEANIIRMNELARKNQDGLLSPEELAELDAYVKAGDLLSLLQLKARKSIKSS